MGFVCCNIMYRTTYKYYKFNQTNRQPFTPSHSSPCPILRCEQRYRLDVLAFASGLVYSGVYSTSG